MTFVCYFFVQGKIKLIDVLSKPSVMRSLNLVEKMFTMLQIV